MPPVVIYSNPAQSDLREIFEYFRASLEFVLAQQAVLEIIEEIERLAVTPC
jgi:plasmid stabilization system protein ParE